ncbi:uncharacterized protein BCR38DRAFT_346878 [Pseudomassariella vexata]|uniref:Uncharacterized protein n=1 Tax=Pseudomassariella vexata TaxID=1141098 RepID=A0A1Y2DTZ3_9PEZI|nr:uncharacterized protein BCR38DRAFT_346878 [Pseudomassariella vexata]ORY62606.1 hypothetical protein BCR38DRAFT_346878 [Pseudomassariella vexata]
MSDAGGNNAGNDQSPGAGKSSAPKDRNCPFCSQAFTSSSLGRHLDLYIKEKNPKPADGVHDVDQIRKMRGSITRRQPRGSLARRDSSVPGTPTASTTTAKSPAPGSSLKRPSIPREGQYVVDQTPKYPFHTSWEATGVINDIPTANAESWDENMSQQQPGQARRASAQTQQRAPTRVAQRQQLDARQKLTDAVDTARAAELALRELLSSWRAAKQQIDMNSLPFDFDPLSLDFPALTLQCLQAPPTLFSSTPHPTSTSWSIQPPAQKQFEALRMWFEEEFRKWRVACAAATTASTEDVPYPPTHTHVPNDLRESVQKAEKAAAMLEKQVDEHLQSTYQVWEQLPVQRRTELWSLELARSVGRRQKEIEKLKEAQHAMKQDNVNLKSQIDQLNHLQQPREFRIMPPTTVPFDQSLVSYCLEFGVKGVHGLGLNIDDRHLDLGALVSRAIERWKNVIVASRGAAGMNAQRPLEQPATTTPATTTPTPVAQTQPKPLSKTQPPQPRQIIPPTTQGPSNDSRSTTTATTTSTSVNDEGSDQDADADAEMEEDDSLAPISTPIVVKPPQQQQAEVPQTRQHAQQRLAANNDARFAMNGAGNMGGNQRMNMNRPMNMNAAAMQAHNQRGGRVMTSGDYNPVVSGVGSGDPMYMD